MDQRLMIYYMQLLGTQSRFILGEWLGTSLTQTQADSCIIVTGTLPWKVNCLVLSLVQRQLFNNAHEQVTAELQSNSHLCSVFLLAQCLLVSFL